MSLSTFDAQMQMLGLVEMYIFPTFICHTKESSLLINGFENPTRNNNVDCHTGKVNRPQNAFGLKGNDLCVLYYHSVETIHMLTNLWR